MSWNKKNGEAPNELSGLAQPASAAQKTTTPASMLTPENQAYTNNLISEAVKGVFAQIGPLLESIALTPEKLAAAEALRRAPDPASVARELRERKMVAQENEENRQNLLRNQANCPHKYPTGQWAVGVVRNFPDRQERFCCMLCHSWFEPRRWEIGPPDADNPRGKAFIAEAHPQYARVREVLASKG